MLILPVNGLGVLTGGFRENRKTRLGWPRAADDYPFWGDIPSKHGTLGLSTRSTCS